MCRTSDWEMISGWESRNVDLDVLVNVEHFSLHLPSFRSS